MTIESVETSEVSLPDIDSLVDGFGTDTDPTEHVHTEEPTEALPAPAPQETPQETPQAAVPPATPAPTDPHEASLAVLAERQRTLHQERETFRAERIAADEAAETLKKQVAEYQSFKTKLERDDALGALADMGIRFDELSQSVLAGTGMNPTSALEQQVADTQAQMKAEIQAQIDELKGHQQTRRETEFVSEAKTAIAAHSPLLASMGDNAVSAIYQRFEKINREATHQGVVPSFPSYQDVIQEIEREYLAFIAPSLQTDAVRALLTPSQPAAPLDAPPTLSNRQAATVTTHTPTTELDQILDSEDRIDAILAKFT